MKKISELGITGKKLLIEGIEVNLYGTCRRSFVDHDVDAVVFHGRIEILFDYG